MGLSLLLLTCCCPLNFDFSEGGTFQLMTTQLRLLRTLHSVTVTTRIITFLVGNSYKPLFATRQGRSIFFGICYSKCNNPDPGGDCYCLVGMNPTVPTIKKQDNTHTKWLKGKDENAIPFWLKKTPVLFFLSKNCWRENWWCRSHPLTHLTEFKICCPPSIVVENVRKNPWILPFKKKRPATLKDGSAFITKKKAKTTTVNGTHITKYSYIKKIRHFESTSFNPSYSNHPKQPLFCFGTHTKKPPPETHGEWISVRLRQGCQGGTHHCTHGTPRGTEERGSQQKRAQGYTWSLGYGWLRTGSLFHRSSLFLSSFSLKKTG